MSSQPKCKFSKPDGTRCNAFCLSGSDYCFHHDPAVSSQRQQARRKGGQARCRPAVVLPSTTPEAQVTSVEGVVALLDATINQVRIGAIDAKVAHTIGSLASVQLRALGESELARRVEEQGRELAAFRSELETMKREQRNAQKAAAPSAKGVRSPAHVDGEESSFGGDPGGRRRDYDAGGYGRGQLADEVAPFFE